jgi:hypothetical protein
MTEGLHPSSCSAPGTHQSVSSTLTPLGCTPRPCVTADPMLARIGLPEWCRGSGRGGVASRDRTRKRRECWVGSTPKLILSAAIASLAPKSLAEIAFCQSSQQAVSDSKSAVNSVLERKIASPQWDGRARSAKRQHRRCIGCGALQRYGKEFVMS